MLLISVEFKIPYYTGVCRKMTILFSLKTLILQWIPSSQCGLHENDTADYLAEGSKEDQPDNSATNSEQRKRQTMMCS